MMIGLKIVLRSEGSAGGNNAARYRREEFVGHASRFGATEAVGGNARRRAQDGARNDAYGRGQGGDQSDRERHIAGAGRVATIPYLCAVVSADEPLAGIVYFHGGAWIFGDLDSHDSRCRMLANESGCRVISIDYRLAPEHKFPAAVEDAYAATDWVAAHGSELAIDPARLAVAGDSLVATRGRSLPAGEELWAQTCIASAVLPCNRHRR